VKERLEGKIYVVAAVPWPAAKRGERKDLEKENEVRERERECVAK